MAAPALVAALQALGLPTDLAQNVGEGAAALAATPAVHQRCPALGLVGKQGLDVHGDIACHQHGAELAGVKGRHLLVQRAHGDALLVVQHRAVDGAGNMVFGKFGRAACIENCVERTELIHSRTGMIN